jgi:hypothetical protein
MEKKASTNLEGILGKDGKILKGAILNPTGKGGFQERPEDISPGGWKKENTISYQYKRFLSMTSEKLASWKTDTPESEKTAAMVLAYNRVVDAKKSLVDVKEITDRTEGKASQSIDLTSKGNELKTALVRFVGEEEENTEE